MKLKLFVFAILFGMIGMQSVTAQKVKIKKGIIYVDKSEFLKYDDEFNNIALQKADGTEFAILKQYTFEKPRKKNPNNPQDWRYGDTITVKYYVITFTDFDLEYETDLSLKKIYGAFYKYKLIDAESNISEENAKKIGSKISKEISGERPVVLLRG